MLLAVATVFAEHRANITYVDLHVTGEHSDIYLEFTPSDGPASTALLDQLRIVPGVSHLLETQSLARIYGKRIVVMGGGAQVGQVALGQSLRPTGTISEVSASRSTQSRL